MKLQTTQEERDMVECMGTSFQEIKDNPDSVENYVRGLENFTQRLLADFATMEAENAKLRHVWDMILLDGNSDHHLPPPERLRALIDTYVIQGNELASAVEVMKAIVAWGHDTHVRRARAWLDAHAARLEEK